MTLRTIKPGSETPLITARSNFQLETLEKPGKCSGCGRAYKAGAQVYVKRWQNPHNRQQVCRTILCNLEECWQEWDAGIFTSGSSGFDNKSQRALYESTN